METKKFSEQGKNIPIEEKKEQDVNYSRIFKSKGISLTFKGICIFILTLLLLIPTIIISELVRERKSRQKEVREEVSEKWANSQTLTGPILIIPYKKIIQSDPKTGNVEYGTENLYILPEKLDIEGIVSPQIRHRSIFDVTVYQSELTFKGHFAPINPESQDIPENDFLPEKAMIYFGLSDFKGIENQLSIRLDNKTYELNASDILSSLNSNGLSSPISISSGNLTTTLPFNLGLKIKGSGDLHFTPIGKTNNTALTSSWNNPSFTGSFLPNTPADISESGFSAKWQVLYLNRNYPQIWKNQTYDISKSNYGVSLLQSTDSYAKAERSVKYAILFIALTFALYFFIEILQKKKVHPLQYGLVGIALCVFYTLLLSIGEYISFDYAYLIASAATITLITLYTKGAFGEWKIAIIFGIVLSSLYGFIYILIQLQDGALLFGSIGLFLLLAVAMYYSKKIDWYGNYQSS
ncbi:cell envelope integrity protein CreD [Bacteroidia bacterium]|nr:cell envelope integrity protein CreD [Bacteroidia bacterium]GHV21277.1 cell envelope integrity protein CreD [Bacteroidia bacterium]